MEQPVILQDPASELEAGGSWLKARVAAAARARVVIGLSGGIDSAVVALWAARALGADALTVVAMPYGLLETPSFAPSAESSLTDARQVAHLIPGADYRELDIAPTVDVEAHATGLARDLSERPDDAVLRVALANLKARVRAVRLRYFANRYNGLLLGTENKTEHYLGYFTIGGDEESDLELIGNYLKTEVIQLAGVLGVPSRILGKAPSADLWHGQTDEDELGFLYSEADEVLDLSACSGEWSPEAAARCALPVGRVEKVLSRVRSTSFKRAAKPVFPRAS